MTDPSPDQPRDPALPDVDTVIHDAREGSWHLPETQAGGAAGSGAGAPDGSPGVQSHVELATTADAAGAHPTSPSHDATTSRGAASAHAPSATDAHDAAAAHAGTAAHIPTAGHGAHGDDHGEEPLGPIDVQNWGAGILAAAIGLLIAACFVFATSGLGAY